MFGGCPPPRPQGRLNRGLAAIAARRDPSLRPWNRRMPLWVRHPFVWLFLQLPARGIGNLTVLGFQFWRALLPFYVAGLLWVAARIAGVWPDGWQTLAILWLLGAPFVAWLAGVPMPKVTPRDPMAPNWARVGIIATWATSFAWTVAAATERFSALLALSATGPLLFWSILAGAGTGWWIQPSREPQQTEPPAIDPLLTRWATRCASEGKRLRGTGLCDLKPLPHGGMSATIDASSTEFDTETLCNAAGYIAARLGLPPTSVVVEPHPSLRNDWARLMVFPDNPLQSVQHFKGISLDKATGWITVGTHTDGRPARWRLWVPGWGACHGLIFGTTGGGKSGLLSVLFTEARNSRLICTFFGDPAMGESAPDWQENVTAFAGTFPRILEMLQGVERMMDERRARRRRTRWQDERGFWRRGSGKFTPTEADPLLLVALDEFSDLAKDPVYGPEILRIVARICKQGRKYGVSIVLLTQIPSLEEMGDSQAIRSMAAGMNIAAFRTSDAMSASMGIPMSLPIDPVNLPDKWPNGELTAGLGYLCRSDAPASPMRGLWVEDTIWWANSGDPLPLPEHLLDAGGDFFRSWFELLDVEDEEVVAVNSLSGAVVRDGNAAKVPAGSVTGKAKDTAWDKIKAFLSDGEHTFGATPKMISEATKVAHNSVCTTLRRREAKGDCHEVADMAGVFRLGPAPIDAVDVDDDGRGNELTDQNPTFRPDGWTAAEQAAGDTERVAS